MYLIEGLGLARSALMRGENIDCYAAGRSHNGLVEAAVVKVSALVSVADLIILQIPMMFFV